ncbi:hypothetical protein ASswx1_49 [Aeromonas phage Asswx_1]|uniref:Uncharacterized protein n=1 Tax=Aeromonas phage Asswx_1 TaxID=2419739 RepID=A0A411B7V0_9CAUD|nr:hypothetical protein ASswx1_49 [Aeromonas phage Asswx_1]
MTERSKKVDRICDHIKNGNFTGDPKDKITIAQTLKLKYLPGGRDHFTDYLVHDGNHGYVGEVFSQDEVNSIQLAFVFRQKAVEVENKNKLFDSIDI